MQPDDQNPPCVPIASDVDCAGGKGNGPAYVRGPVIVIGTDIHGLDRDGDGIGCERGLEYKLLLNGAQVTQRHLDDLENALNRAHWIVSERLPGNNYKISGYWTICRPDGSHQTTLSFDGLDDLNTLPMDRSYGCDAKSIEGASLYFSKGSCWSQNLREFITVLEAGKQC